MSAYPLTICFVVVLLCIHLVCVESQDFCESYEKNNYSLIVFSQSNDTILLIIGKHFWRLRENGTELVFFRNDFQASNSSEQWSETDYTYALAVYEKDNSSYRGIVLFKHINKMTNEEKSGTKQRLRKYYYDFHGNYFSDTKVQEYSASEIFDEKRFSFSIFQTSMDCEFKQMFNKTMKKFVAIKMIRRLHERAPNNSYPGGFQYKALEVDSFPKIESNIVDQIPMIFNIKSDVPIIGSLLNSKNQILIFFRIGNDIKYCAVKQCIETKYTVLISCPLKASPNVSHETTSPQIISPETLSTMTLSTTTLNPEILSPETLFYDKNLWIIFVILFVIIVVIVIVMIAAIVIYCKRQPKPQNKNKYKMQSDISIITINSETGLPLHHSKSEKSVKNAKKVSPKILI